MYFIRLCFYNFFPGWCLIDISQLNTIVKNVNCPQCLTPSLKFTRKEDGWLGFYYLFAVECSTCEVTCSTSYSSQRTESDQSCRLDYTGSSGAVEVDAASRLWSSSAARGLRYTGFLSDGDSTAYNSVVKLDVYDVPIVKEECVNHIHKRMGTALRNLTTRKRLGGYHKLHGAVTSEIAAFNEGAAHMSQVLQRLAIESNQVMNLYIEEYR